MKKNLVKEGFESCLLWLNRNGKLEENFPEWDLELEISPLYKKYSNDKLSFKGRSFFLLLKEGVWICYL